MITTAAIDSDLDRAISQTEGGHDIAHDCTRLLHGETRESSVPYPPDDVFLKLKDFPSGLVQRNVAGTWISVLSGYDLKVNHGKLNVLEHLRVILPDVDTQRTQRLALDLQDVLCDRTKVDSLPSSSVSFRNFPIL